LVALIGGVGTSLDDSRGGGEEMKFGKADAIRTKKKEAVTPQNKPFSFV